MAQVDPEIKSIMRNIVLIIALFLSQTMMACVDGTRITTQAQFDEAVARINKGEEMHMVLRKGQYILKQTMVAKAPLSIKGKGAVLTCASTFFAQNKVSETSTHTVYRLDKSLSEFTLFYDDEENIVPVSESVIDSIGVNYVEGDISGPTRFAVDTEFQIPISKNLYHLKNKTFACAFGYIDCGWDVAKFSIKRSDDSFFYCTILTTSTIDNIRYDAQAYKKPIRYVIYNAEPKAYAVYYDKENLYIPKSIKRVYCVNRPDIGKQIPNIITYADISIDGVRFVGIEGIEVNSESGATCEIKNCYFAFTIGRALSINKTNGKDVKEAEIDGNTFMYCSVVSDQAVFLKSTNDGENCIRFINNTVSKYPAEVAYYKNPRASVYAIGCITLSNNVVYNSCRDHLFLNQGRIEAWGNVLYNTDGFNRYGERNQSSDFGLIYCAYVFKDTQAAQRNTTHKILIENNLLYGAYAYGGDARGIFIDDGRGDVTCRGNVVLNAQVYSIDARNSNLTKASSIRNRYEGNVVTSRYRLVAGQEVNGDNVPTTSRNLLLTSDENVTGSIRTLEKDIRKEGRYESICDGNKIQMSRDLYREIRKSPTWKSVRKFVKKK